MRITTLEQIIVAAQRKLRFVLAALLVVFAALPLSAAWTRVDGALTQVSAGSAQHVWGVNAGQNIYRRTGSAWEQIPGALVNVSVGADGAVWGVNSEGHIYRRDGSAWTKIPGALVQISVGNAQNVWGVNSAGEIYRWSSPNWVRVPGSLKWVEVGADGAVWGVNSDNGIYRWEGQDMWAPIGGALAQITVGNAQKVWGVAADGAVQQRFNNTWVSGQGPMRQMDVASDGTAWAVDNSGGVFTANVSAIEAITWQEGMAIYEQNRRSSTTGSEILFNANPNYYIWYTLYSWDLNAGLTRDKLAWGCIPPNSYTFKNYPSTGGTKAFKILIEVKQGPACYGGNVCATDSTHSYPGNAPRYPVARPNGNNCYIEWASYPDSRGVGWIDLYRASYVAGR